MIKKETEKILKYKDLIIEIQRIWNVRAKMITVTRVATGTISKSLRHKPSNVPGRHEIKETQKTAVLGTALTAESACVKVQNKTYFRYEITLHVAQL